MIFSISIEVFLNKYFEIYIYRVNEKESEIDLVVTSM